jgi:hypothetical protein
MLNISRLELARRGTQDVGARDRRLRHTQRHDILQLIAKSVGAA